MCGACMTHLAAPQYPSFFMEWPLLYLTTTEPQTTPELYVTLTVRVSVETRCPEANAGAKLPDSRETARRAATATSADLTVRILNVLRSLDFGVASYCERLYRTSLLQEA